MADDDYAKAQPERDWRYRDAWKTPEAKAWLESLPPKERAKLEAEGLLAPDIPRSGSANGCGLDDDAAASPGARVEAPKMSASDSLDAILADYPHLEAAIEERARKMACGSGNGCDVLASFCAHIRSCANPVLVFDAVCYATGVGALEGQSGTELATKHGVTKQAFSKIAVEWCKTFGLQPSRSMKSKMARKAYEKRALRAHARRRRLTRRKRA